MICPVCAYSEMPYPAADYNICPSCGTEFGNDDILLSHDELRAQWLAGGAHWFFGNPPAGWNPYLQLIEGHLPFSMPGVSVSVAPMDATVVGSVLRQEDYDLIAA
jgi:hypothetical protein